MVTYNMFGLYNNDLPEVLNKDEEKKLIENNDNESKNVLIERNLRLVLHIAKKFTSSGESIEDLASIGTIGLIKAVNTFEPQKNILLTTYVSTYIKNEILKHLKKYKKTKKEISINKVISTDKNGKSFTCIDTLYDESDSSKKIENVEIRYSLKQAIELLDEHEREIIRLRYNIDDDNILSQRKVAAIVGTSQASVFQIEKRAIKKLKKYLSNF